MLTRLRMLTSCARLRDRATDAVIALLVGDPVRSVILGALVLWLVGQWLGGWAVAAIVGGAVVDAVWRAIRLRAWRQPW